MAQRNFTQNLYSLSKKRVVIDVEVTFGSSGSPTLATASAGEAPKNKGVASISRTSTGLFVLTLSDRYQRVAQFRGTFKAASGIVAAPDIALKTAANGTAPTGMVITFTTTAPTGASNIQAVTDPASGETGYFEVVLEDSTV